MRTFNESLPCGAVLERTYRQGRYTAAVFRLTERPGPGRCGTADGRHARTAFIVRDGKIRQWRRLPRPAGAACAHRVTRRRMHAVKRLAEGLYMLSGFPPNAINVYLMGDVLVDAGTRHSGRRIFRQLRGHQVATHALTHAHPDHQGASKEVCERLGIELWCGERDADAMESGNLGQKDHLHQQGDHVGLGGTAVPGGAPAAGGRRGRRLHGCSTCRGTRPATWPTGGSRTGR